ncbi:MAG: glycosyltransferase family 4 protein [Acidiferrobacterales bacterium]|nr:glycosyltransferase family 4 protein [Acidiferrobacterales bacterium]
MKIIIVAQRFPYPLDKGDRLTIYHLIKFLSQRHEITLVTFKEKSHDPAWDKELSPYCARIETLPVNKWRGLVNCAKGIFDQMPLQIHYTYDPAMKSLVDRVIRETKPDLLYAHYLRAGVYTEAYRDTPRVMAMQLSMTLNYKRLAENASSWIQKKLFSIEHKRLQRFEPEFARQFDKVMLISQRDLAAVNANPPLNNVFFNPHGVDFEYFSPDTGIKKQSNTLVFSGNMEYPPNIDGAVRFCNEVLPLIKKRIPDIRFYIVGTSPTPDVLALAKDPAVIVTGRVPDLRQYMLQAEVAIAPMRITAGLLNKVLEALSMGLPLVATPQANEGIEAEDGSEIIIAASNEKFAEQIIELLNDAERREALGIAGRRFILEKWTWEAHLEDLEQMFIELVGSKSRTD